MRFYHLIGVVILMICAMESSSYAMKEKMPGLLVPMPLSVQPGSGPGFEITSQTLVVCDPKLTATADFLAAFLDRAGISIRRSPLEEKSSSPSKAIILQLDPVSYPTTDSYGLKVSAQGIRISGSSPAGVFYGIQTLRQLLPASVETSPKTAVRCLVVPAVEIRDQPALGWRGLMLDCSRHFMDVATLKQLLDVMAFLKMNRFHWHLIDGNGWRLQIDKYPLLTEKAAWRGPANARYGGFYSKADVREIVAYAASRHIEVIPEFEMPGHSDAALMAYPQFSCLGTPYLLPAPDSSPGAYDSLGWYTDKGPSRPFCAGNDECFRFIEDLFDESLDLFPYPVWHVGGDERPEGQWDKCPKCQARMKTLNLPDEHALQLWFMRRVSDILARKGKTCISWAIPNDHQYYNPQALDDLGNQSILMNWHGATHFACTHGMKVVNATCGSMYLDYPPFPMYPGWERPSWMAFLPLHQVYSFEPVPAGLTAEQVAYVVGAQTCVWTEFIPQEQLFSWIFPRVLAAAEAEWLPADKRKDFEGFQLRVTRLEERFARMGIAFGHPLPSGNDGHNLRQD